MQDSLEGLQAEMEEMRTETEIDQLQRGLTQCLTLVQRALVSLNLEIIPILVAAMILVKNSIGQC